MEGWWIVVGAILAIVIVTKLIHFKHLKHKISAIAIVCLLLFLGLSFMKITQTNSVDLKSPTGIFSGINLYFSWLGQVFGNVKVITGNVVRMDWFGNLTA